jgi:tRNA (guanine9-N1)-methyltransferase
LDICDKVSPDGFKKEQLVYLTADSSNEITDLDPKDVYIIGGIVDRNRHKELTIKKAIDQGIRHARLPISDYLSLNTSCVLTVNHVFDIMA